MAKRKPDSPGAGTPGKRAHPPDRAGGASASAPACADCGGTALIWSGGDEYCSECGAVADSVLLTADYEHVPDGEQRGNYVPHRRRANKADPGDVRFHKSWNRGMTAEAHASISALCAELDLRGLAERCQRIFDDSIRALMGAGARVVFGSWAAVRVCACVYIAAREAGKVLGLVDIARAARISVFIVGREVKRALASLDIHLPSPDPLLQAETAVNRVVGLATNARRDTALKSEIIAKVAGSSKAAQQLPARLLEFLPEAPQTRPALVEATGAIMAFDRACSRHTGVNPNTLVCSALAIATEHVFVTSEDADIRALKPGQRDVIIKLVALRNGAGHRTIAMHATETQKALVQASTAVPWLTGMTITRNNVAAHALDIAFCYGQAQSWLFSLRAGPECDAAPPHHGAGAVRDDSPASGSAAAALSRLVASLEKAPSFARAESRRARRAKMLDAATPQAVDGSTCAPGGDSEREADVVGRLHQLGVSHHALLTLPLPTLEHLLPVAARSRELTDQARELLDLPTVGTADMSDEEIAAYLRCDLPDRPAGPATP
ncbi:hypothetical protein LPJ61_003553 [Coemansia biformis]|uniref:TFIIB-type domain-containing protein n=1 Tax=Coemansia biformis TaxID=1286918 RepID=A0A9W7YCM2_9FUNG|nr:hypothetical protein LPJ61_003553 [Coemansia biformis]